MTKIKVLTVLLSLMISNDCRAEIYCICGVDCPPVGTSKLNEPPGGCGGSAIIKPSGAKSKFRSLKSIPAKK